MSVEPCGLPGYWAAWRGLSSPEEASRRLTTLVAIYLRTVTGEDHIVPLDEHLRRLAAADPNLCHPVVRSDGSETERRSGALWRVLLTLYYVVVFFPLDPQHSPLRVAMVKWKAFVLGQGGEGAFASKVRALIQRKLQGNGRFSDADTLVIVADLVAPPTPVSTPLELASGTLLSVLTAQHLAAHKTSDILGVVFNRLRRDAADGSFVTLTAFLLRHVVSSPFTDPALLDVALQLYRSYHAQPLPLASLAVHMLKTLTQEARSPGAAWRRVVEAAFPVLAGLPPTGRELDAFVLAAPDSGLASLLESMVVAVPSERELTASVVTSLFQCCGVGGGEDEGAPPLAVERLTLKKLRGVYAKVRACLEQALQMTSVADATAFVMERLEQLHRAAAKHVARARTAATAAPAPPRPSLLLCGLPYQFHVHRVAFDCALAGREVGTKWPRRNALKPLREIVADVLRGVDTGQRVVARLVIEGGDYEVHHVLGAYVALLQSDPQVVARVRFRFHVVPTGRRPSVLAAFLATIDPWYAKTVAAGARGPPSLAPTLAPDATAPPAPVEVPMDVPSFGLPPFVLHSVLSDYLTLARRTNRLAVYQCECWQKSVSAAEVASKYVIPFMLTAEVGLTAQARTFQTFNELPPMLPVAEIAACKAFKFKPPVLTLKITSATLLGGTRVETAHANDARPWQEIYMAAVPVAGQPCDAPGLGASWLEMSATAAGDPLGAAAQKKSRARNQYRYHARSVEIEGHNKSTFDVCLDGVAYGPFQKVVIAALPDVPAFPVVSFHNLLSNN